VEGGEEEKEEDMRGDGRGKCRELDNE